jgi:hypothetical protein
MRTINAKGGPLDGKTVQVPDHTDTFTHHADDSSHYKVNEKTATWQGDKTKPVA